MALFYHPLVVFAEPWNLSKVITVMFFGILFVGTSGFTIFFKHFEQRSSRNHQNLYPKNIQQKRLIMVSCNFLRKE